LLVLKYNCNLHYFDFIAVVEWCLRWSSCYDR